MSNFIYPDYWQQATAELSECDEVLARLIADNRGLHLRSRGDAFFTLARSIVGQQVSVKAAETIWQKAAETIWQRVVDKVGEMSPHALIRVETPELQACGLSSRKVSICRTCPSTLSPTRLIRPSGRNTTTWKWHGG